MKTLIGLNPFYNLNIINKEKTTASLCVGNFTEGEKILSFDKEWEGDHCVYHNFFVDDGVYKMYYLAHSSFTPFTELKVCYAYSYDGKNWVKPNLGLREYNGSKENNIVLNKTDKDEGDFFDNFFVFKDENPTCLKEQKYKALAYTHPYKLMCYFSEDGINFKRGYQFDIDGKFDTLNVCFFDKTKNKYVAYIRDFHGVPENGDLNLGVRDIRVTESEDFKKWSEPKLINFGENRPDFPLYTNNVMRHPKNDNLYIGFPSRYIERKEWTDNYEKLTGKEARIKRMEDARRYGLALTDCLFMVSENGKDWCRFDKALITPGIECEKNWVYGDCYPAYGLSEDENHYKILLRKNQWSDACAEINEFNIRKDGFAYYNADYGEYVVELVPMILSGSNLYLNFSTSAAGSVYMQIESEDGEKITSCEMFGDSVKREVSIDKKELEKFVGKKVIIKFKMTDAKIYSLTVE